MVRREWPQRRGRNAVADLVLFSEVNGKLLRPWISFLHSISGQISEWVRAYLNASVPVKDIIAEIYTAGDDHGPAAFLTACGDSDESQFRYAVGPYVQRSLEVWNSYFDTHGVDVLLTPAQFCDAQTYECRAGRRCSMQRDYGDGYGTTHDAGNLHCNFVSFFMFKQIPVPKVTVPVGLDPQGRPVSVEFWGRAGPPKGHPKAETSDWMYDDDFARTADLDFLHMVAKLVAEIQAKPSLRRAEAKLVTGEGNLFA